MSHMHVRFWYTVIMTLFKVGQVSESTGKTVRALHVYEDLGLLKSIRSAKGQRLFDGSAKTRVEWIEKLQELGLSLADIGELLSLHEQATSGPEAKDKIHAAFSRHLDVIENKITQLHQLKDEIKASLDVLEQCTSCAPTTSVDACPTCSNVESAPSLVGGLHHSGYSHTPPAHSQKK